MAIDVERERVAFPIQDDPMRTFDDPRNGNRPAFAGAINGTYARTLLPLVPIGRRTTTG